MPWGWALVSSGGPEPPISLAQPPTGETKRKNRTKGASVSWERVWVDVERELEKNREKGKQMRKGKGGTSGLKVPYSPWSKKAKDGGLASCHHRLNAQNQTLLTHLGMLTPSRPVPAGSWALSHNLKTQSFSEQEPRRTDSPASEPDRSPSPVRK